MPAVTSFVAINMLNVSMYCVNEARVDMRNIWVDSAIPNDQPHDVHEALSS